MSENRFYWLLESFACGLQAFDSLRNLSSGSIPPLKHLYDLKVSCNDSFCNQESFSKSDVKSDVK